MCACLLTAAAFAGPAVPVAATDLSDAAVRAKIVAAVERDRATYGGKTPVPGVIVGVLDANGHSYLHAFGYENLTPKVPLRLNDHFRIGSNTKVFVVTVLLQLVDEGKLSLDDPLSKFDIGVTIPNGDRITVREACEMRSGLFEVFDVPELGTGASITPESKWDPRTLVKWAVRQKPYFAPGKAYKYSNTNYLILGLIVQAVTHDTIEHQIATRILVPYNLRNTTFPTTIAMPSPWARGYGLDAHKNWEDVSNTIPVSLMWAAGAMISDMADMNRWVKLYVTGKTNGAKTQRERMRCIWTGEGNLSFGLGLGCSAGWYGYTGGLPGYNTATYYFPSTGITVTAWVDLQRHKPFPGVANAIFRDIARVMTPANVPFLKTAASTGKSGL
jgi:D-alanyl-D-alanine carboxypeptidase